MATGLADAGAGRSHPALRLSLAPILALFVFSMCLTVWVPFAITIGGLNLRASQVLLPAVGVLLLFRPLPDRVSLWSLLVVAGGLVWWASLVFWTLVNGPELGRPMARVVLVGLNLLQGVAAYVLIVRVGDLRVAIRALLVSATLLNGLLLAVSYAASRGVPIPTIWLSEQVAPVLVDGQLVSATVLRFSGGGVLAGCVSAATAVLALCLWFDPHWRHRWLLAVAGAASMAGMVLGFSRQSVLSLVIGLVVTAPLLARGHPLRLVKLAALGVLMATLAVGVIFASPTGRQFWSAFAGRTAQFVDPGAYVTGTAGSRAAIWSGMMSDVSPNPFVGQGQDAYLRYMGLEEQGAHNFPIEVLHSSGVLGLLGFLVLHGVAPAVALALIARRRSSDSAAVVLIAILGAYAASTAAALTNLIYWNPTYWLVLAMMVAAVRLTAREARWREAPMAR